MPNDKLPPWDARSRKLPRGPEVRRALDPETGKPFGRLTLPEKLKLKTMNALIRPFVSHWLPRQILKLLAPIAAAIGATAEGTQQTALFLTAAAGFLLEMLFSWISNKWARRNAAAKLPASVILPLLLLVFLVLPGLTSCAVTRPVGIGLQKVAEVSAETGSWPAGKLAASDLPTPCCYVLAPVVLVPAVAGVAVAFPFWLTGTALGGQWDY